MNSELLGLVLLLELVLAISTTAPLTLSGKFREHPNFGIGIWFLLLITSLGASVAALVIAFGSVFQSYFSLQAGEDLGQTLLISFAPWILLAFAGVLLAITNLRLAPYFQARGQDLDLNQLSKSTSTEFQRVSVRELSVPGYLAITQSGVIYLSSSALQLDEAKMEAILWHEYGHIRLRHQALKTISAFALTIAPWFLVSRVFAFELDRLCELAADNYALKRVAPGMLQEARSLFF